MTIYKNKEQFDQALKALFERIHDDPSVVRTVEKSRLVIRFQFTGPEADIAINGRVKPPQVSSGETKLRPDLDISLTADAFHYILMAELGLRKALSSGQMKVRGPIWKAFVFEEILHRGQAVYPELVREMGIGNSTP